MNQLRFSDAKRFNNVVKKYLARHEAENNLVLGILANVLTGEYRDIDPYMALIQDQGEILQVMLRTPPFPVLFSYRQEAPDDEMADLAVGGLQDAYGDQIGGMTGDQQVVKSYAALWGQVTQADPVVKTAMRLYKLNQVHPVSGVPGTLRLATMDDLALVMSWFGGFQRETLGVEDDAKRLRNSVCHYLTGNKRHRGMAVWEVEGRPVSMAGYSGPTQHGIRISAVYTPPDLRGNGYASACVAALSQYLLDQGYRFCFLFTDVEHPTPNHIYRDIGYRPVSDVDKVVFKKNGG